MSELVLKDCKITASGVDITGYSNTINIEYTNELQDRTVFGSSFRKRLAGLNDVQVSGGGFIDSSSQDNFHFGTIAATRSSSDHGVITVIPEGTSGGSSGPIAYFADALHGEYSIGGTVGEMHGYTFAAQGNGALRRGRLLLDNTAASDTTGQFLNLGEVSSTQRLYGAIHNRWTSTGNTTGDVVVSIWSGDSSAGGADTRQRIVFNEATTGVIPNSESTRVAVTADTSHTWYWVEAVASNATEVASVAVTMGII